MILDTTFVIDVLHGEPEAFNILDEIESPRVQQKVSSMTVFELSHGVARADKPDDERQEVLSVLESKSIVSANERIMAKAGRIHGRLKNDGLPIGQGDCIVGATGLVHGEPVLTRNVDHFGRIDGLDVRAY